MNIGEVTRNVARQEPDRVALICDDVPCSYGELEELVGQAAGALVAAGVGEGERIAMLATSSPLAVAAMLAAARIGAAAALINVHLTPGEIAKLLDTAKCSGILIAGDSYAANAREAVALRGKGRVLGARELFGGTQEARESQPEAGEALALFTSGTTGLPKAIGIGHDVVAQRLEFFGVPFEAGSGQSVDMMSVPLFHIGGSLGVFITLYSGNKMVTMSRFDAGEWLRQVQQHKVNRTFLVPTMLDRILAHPDFERTELSSLETIHYGAAAARVELVIQALERFPGHVDFLNTFGQTETLGAYAALTPEDHRARRHLGSAGKPFPGVEVRIVTPGTDTAVATGETGEILVRAAQNVADGWLRTGDLGWQNEEGYLFPCGRLSDTINRGGEKFGPIEIEDVIEQLEGVREVAAAGVPDDELGERVGVAIAADGSLSREDVLEHCRRHLARYKLPEYVAFVDEIPRTAMGKVSRRQLARVILTHNG